MTVTFELRQRCVVCGYHQRGFMVRTVRVNKRSLRSTDTTGLGALMDPCMECGTENGREGFAYVGLDPRSQVKVEAYRARRWVA